MSALFNLFYIYDPWAFHFLRMSFVAGAISLLFLAYKWYKKEINQIVIPKDSLMVSIGLIIFSVLPIIIHGTQEFGVVSMYVKSFIFLVTGIIIYNLFYQNNNAQNQLIRDLKWGISIQSLFGLLALLGIPLMISLTLGTNADYFLPRFQGSEQEYRLYNITSSAFFQLSAFYLMLLHFLLAYNKKNNQLQGIFLFLMLFIGTISGRSFLIFSVISILIYFKRRYIPYLLLFAVTVILLALFLPENKFVAHALEPIINLIKMARGIPISLSSSTDTLMNKHLFMPELKQILMGDGLYFTPDQRYYGGSDSGFIRQTLYGGFIYVLICFLFTTYFVKRIADNWLDGSWIYILSTIGLLTILNVKADTYAFPGIMMVLLMFLSLFGTSGKNWIIFNKK